MVGDKTIDWELGIRLANGNEELARELLTILKEELVTHKAKLIEHYTMQDWPELQKEVHKLHGATCYTGTPKLKDAACNLERKLKDFKAADKYDIDSIKRLHKCLIEEIDAVNSNP
jgi:two-component system, NarL family, sensor histidine kinase BarA